MSLFDIIVSSITLLSALTGFIRGFVYLSIGMISFLCALVSSYFVSPLVKPAIGEFIKNQLAAGIVTGISSFLLCTIFFAVLSGQLRYGVKELRGGIIDRLCGIIAGIIRGVAISLVIFSLITIVSSNAYVGVKNLKEVAAKLDEKDYPNFLKKSKFYQLFFFLSKTIGGVLPDSLLESITMPSNPDYLGDTPISKPELEITVDKDQSIKMRINSEDKKPQDQESSMDDLEKELETLLQDKN
ncbi:MAG: CvpA family protein [Rickettsiaceae bacterium]|nr:CvpA family protein [Rickettsiaceae bacterium]